MGMTLAQKLIKSHLLSGDMSVVGSEIGLKIDQTLTQDSTGTMAYIEFTAMNIPRVKTELSVAYCDHNMIQSGFENADDHLFIQSVAEKHGLKFSRPGNGICHQVHLERYGKPGKTLLGSDSHTPTGGALGMLAIGAGGLDVAVAMGGGAYYIAMPRMIKVHTTGKLKNGVSAKDASLELLRRISVKGGVGAMIEWGGPGIDTLTVPERATIANMGTEVGCTTTVFPSDDVTRQFLAAQGREEDWTPLASDPDAVYDQVIEIALDELVPLAACPHSPDNVQPLSELTGIKVNQVCIGSCTNSSFVDMMKVAAILKGKTVAPGVSLSVSPGSRQVLAMLSECGALTDILESGARVLECACGPCIGMGFSPNSGGVSLRTFNRNFIGRSGTKDAKVYLVSPETAAASALTGYITEAHDVAEVKMPEHFRVNDTGVLPPADMEAAAGVEILRGPNIKPYPDPNPIADSMAGELLLKVGDNITTDHIMPAGAKILPYRSNIPKISEFCFEVCDKTFHDRALAAKGGFIVGGVNYGQGSSREHAALSPRYLGIRAVIAKSFARIHQANLINNGIMPLTFQNEIDYDDIDMMDELALPGIRAEIEAGKETFTLRNVTKGHDYPVLLSLTERQRGMILCGGLLNYTKESQT